jgi:hypothetical protein
LFETFKSIEMKKKTRLLFLLIPLSITLFSCQPQETIMPQVVHVKFYNKTKFDLTGLKLSNGFFIGDLTSNASTGFLDLPVWSSSPPDISSKEITGHHWRCGNESYFEIQSGHYELDILSGDDGSGNPSGRYLGLTRHYE